MLAIGIAFVPSFMRLTRSSVLALREMTYVEAAASFGQFRCPNSGHGTFFRIRCAHLLVLITLGIGSVHSGRCGAQLPWSGRGAAHRGMGRHAKRRNEIRTPGLVADRLPRCGDLPRCALHQPDR